jgi:hypothetical protein
LPALIAGVRRTDGVVAQQSSEDDAYLHGREGRADAAANSTTVGDPFRGVGASRHEAIGIEPVRIVEDRLVGVQQADAGDDRLPLRQRPRPDLQRRACHLTERGVDDRSRAQDLEDGGGQEFLGAGIDVGDETVKQLWMSLQSLDGPGKGGGSRVVAGRQHGDQLVGDLRASHR